MSPSQQQNNVHCINANILAVGVEPFDTMSLPGDKEVSGWVTGTEPKNVNFAVYLISGGLGPNTAVISNQPVTPNANSREWTATIEGIHLNAGLSYQFRAFVKDQNPQHEKVFAGFKFETTTARDSSNPAPSSVGDEDHANQDQTGKDKKKKKNKEAKKKDSGKDKKKKKK